jgi:3-oxoadipate enol-lactonase
MAEFRQNLPPRIKEKWKEPKKKREQSIVEQEGVRVPRVRVNDFDMYYEMHGNGFPLVLISGYSGSTESWDVLVPRVAELSKHYRVLTFDNRGAGRSGAPKGDYSIKTMGDDVAGLLDSLEISKPHVLGQSMGGMIAQELAINHSKKVNGLILVCTTPKTSNAIHGQQEALQKLKWMFAPPKGMSQEVVFEKIMKLCYHKSFFEKNRASIMGFMPKYPTSPSTLEKHYDAIIKFDTYNRLRMIHSRTLVIHGQDDKLIMPEGARILAKHIPNAELRMFQQAGHVVLEEKWQEAKPIILDFLKRSDVS